MKREFLISRLDEPNIAHAYVCESDHAHAYVCESDQNLLNNIRILCTRQPETLRYFVPEELFWEIKNGETVAITAECYDEYGRWMFTVDPLKVLSGQLWDKKIYLEDEEGLDIRIRIDGYALPRKQGSFRGAERSRRQCAGKSQCSGQQGGWKPSSLRQRAGK